MDTVTGRRDDQRPDRDLDWSDYERDGQAAHEEYLAANPPPGVQLTLGYTLTNRAGDYVPSLDGYLYGADQDTVDLVFPDLDGGLDPLQWAEAAFVASNAPEWELVFHQPGATLVYSALADYGEAHPDARPWSLSVGDTVSVTLADGTASTWVCTGAGWSQLTTAPPFTVRWHPAGAWHVVSTATGYMVHVRQRLNDAVNLAADLNRAASTKDTP